MPKFIIVDQSLYSLQGHHYECSISVAEAAIRLGYEAIIVANRAFDQSLHPDNIKIIPAFEVDWFDNPLGTPSLPRWKQVLQQGLKFLNGTSLRQSYQNLEEKVKFKIYYLNLTKPKTRLFLEKVQGSTSRLLGWIKQDISLLNSIPLTNTLWGLFKIIWGLIRFAFSLIFEKLNQIVSKLVEIKPVRFIDTLAQVVRELQTGSNDHIFIHTISISQVEELYYYLHNNTDSQTPCYHILLRRDIEDALVVNAQGMGLKSLLNQFYKTKLWPSIVRFYTDTEDLVIRHNSLSLVQFIQIPLPFRQEKIKEIVEQNALKPIHVVYLGDARPEKGYQYLPKLVSDLWTEYIQPGKIKFTIQSNFSINGGETGMLEARLQLECYPAEKVSLIQEPIEADSYYQLLAEADVIVLPYDVHSYRFRTSGVLTEALAAGKPVIVPANSWLAKQVDEARASIYKTLEDLTKSVIRIIQNIDSYSANANQFKYVWQKQHSPDSLIKILVSKAEFQKVESVQELVLAPPQSVPKVLMIFEGDRLITRNEICDRLIAHIEYFLRCGYQVFGIFFPVSNLYRNENFDLFRQELSESVKKFAFCQTWILNYLDAEDYLLHSDIDTRKYAEDTYHNRASLERSLVERYNLEIPLSIQSQNFDIIFSNSIASQKLIEKLGFSNLPIICQVSELLSYQYARLNREDINLKACQLEGELFNQCEALIFYQQHELEKVAPFLHHPLLKTLPIPAISYSALKEHIQLMNNVLTHVLQEKALTFEKNLKKVAVLYPWGSILERNSGASKRVGLLVDYLKENSYQVWFFTPGTEQEFRQEGIRYSYYQQDFSESSLVTNVYQDAYQSWVKSIELMAEKSSQVFSEDYHHWLPWIYYQFRFDPTFKAWIEKIVDWADVIILEYPFWATIVGEICRQYHKKLIITAHDVLSKQLPENTLISKIALAEEIQGLKQADYLITVSQSDRLFFQQYSLDSQVIPNPVDLERDCSVIQKLDEVSKNALEKLGDTFCLFVGSFHPPNIEAVKNIRQIAKEFSQQYPEHPCTFIVVGECCEPQQAENFLALGKVEYAMLSTIYLKAVLILSPILAGTGTSLKTVEAMAYGKVILGTQVAFRGYPVQSGYNCIICDNLTQYPAIAASLLNTPERLQEIRQNAREFAKAYDYRRLYEEYKRVIDNGQWIIDN